MDIYKENVDKRVLTNRWQKIGDKAKYKSIVSDRSSVEVTRPTSRFVQQYNALSWSSLELGYDFGPRITNMLSMSMLRLTLGMSDLFHLSNVKQERGLSYPFARTVNFSLKMAF